MEKRQKDGKKKQWGEWAAQAMHGQDTSDVLGSYTGTPTDGTEPTQDADDL